MPPPLEPSRATPALLPARPHPTVQDSRPTADAPPSAPDARLSLAVQILAVSMFAAVFYHYSRFAFTPPYSPFLSSFFHYPANIFCDFYAPHHVYIVHGFAAEQNYLPGATFCIHVFNSMGQGSAYRALQAMLWTGIPAAIAALTLLIKGENRFHPRQAVLALLLGMSSYPILFSLHTGNLEFICFICIAASLALRNVSEGFVSAFAIAFAASIKGYPLLFLLPLLTRHNFLRLSLVTGACFLFFLTAPFFLSGDPWANVQHWLGGLRNGSERYLDFMVFSKVGVNFGHSLVNSLQLLFPTFDIKAHMSLYFACAGPLAAMLLLIGAWSPRPHVCVLSISVAVCLFPLTSQDYRLQYFVLALVLNCLAPARRPVDNVLLGLTLAAIAYKGYFFAGNDFVRNSNIYLTSLVMIALTVVLFSGWRESWSSLRAFLPTLTVWLRSARPTPPEEAR